MSSIFGRTVGPLVLGWAPNNFILVAKPAPGEKIVSLYPCICHNYQNLMS